MKTETTTKPALDLSKLLGFDAIVDQSDAAIDFREDGVAARLGAKVGSVEPVSPAR